MYYYFNAAMVPKTFNGIVYPPKQISASEVLIHDKWMYRTNKPAEEGTTESKSSAELKKTKAPTLKKEEKLSSAEELEIKTESVTSEDSNKKFKEEAEDGTNHDQ